MWVRVHEADEFFVFLLTPLFHYQLKIEFASNDIRAYMACSLSIGTGFGMFRFVVVEIDTILMLQYWETLYCSITWVILPKCHFTVSRNLQADSE
jgi:hypothetical protein